MQRKAKTIILMGLAYTAGLLMRIPPAQATIPLAPTPLKVTGVPLDDEAFMKKLLQIEYGISKANENLDSQRMRPLLPEVRP